MPQRREFLKTLGGVAAATLAGSTDSFGHARALNLAVALPQGGLGGHDRLEPDWYQKKIVQVQAEMAKRKLEALVLLGAYSMVASQRRFFLGKSFVVMWWGFLLVAAGALAAEWALVSVLRGAIVDPRPVAVEFVMTLAFFPFVTWLLVWAQKSLLRQV